MSRQPDTEAGRALLDTLRREWHPDPPYHAELSILAIEAEARAPLRAALVSAEEFLAADGFNDAHSIMREIRQALATPG